MGLFSGSASFTRFRVQSTAPRMFDQSHLDQLNEHAAGRQRMVASDGIEFGWSGGSNILDTQFGLAKNVIDDMLCFSLRIDTMKLPADLLKAYYDIDLAALSRNNPSGFASRKQKREAKESARDRLEQEAKDGRYTKRKAIEVVWDSKLNEVLFGSNSPAQMERLALLFERTFKVKLSLMTAGKLADGMADVLDDQRCDVEPSSFIPGLSPSEVSWVPDEASNDFVGNEFLLWLWYQCDDESAEIKLNDNSTAVVMFSRAITLDCPRGQTGRESISHAGPTRLPEAMQAIKGGKMPRKAGLTVVRHGVQYELTLLAESLAISGAKIPAPEIDGDRARLEARAQQLRDLIQTIDILFDAFVSIRFTAEWRDQLARMQRS